VSGEVEWVGAKMAVWSSARLRWSALKPRNTQEQVWAAEAVFETGILNNI